MCDQYSATKSLDTYVCLRPSTLRSGQQQEHIVLYDCSCNCGVDVWNRFPRVRIAHMSRCHEPYIALSVLTGRLVAEYSRTSHWVPTEIRFRAG